MSFPSPAKSADLWDFVEDARPQIEQALIENLPLATARDGADFNDALRYALFPGGKRLRPVLTLLGAEAVGGRASQVLQAAAAVEFVHTSSLIFDDLPCMDNATERRGQVTLHLRYSEGLAVLAALALMNASYGLMFDSNDLNYRHAITAHRELVACIGANGMVVGQTVDLAIGDGSGARASSDQVRNLKTSALMRLALRLGAILSGANEKQLSALTCFAEKLGDAYQTIDDVLDLSEDEALAMNGARRATFASARGASDAIQRTNQLVAEAKRALTEEFGDSRASRLLGQLSDYIATRRS
ncbi:MAG: polyprenyl synthetase family protein [Pyrinomonadaceae bacterium]|nr:polyprenyl synthetase family protein [Pyrinomonadaceae bacterium]